MKLADCQNLRVEYDGVSFSSWAVLWETDDARYHVWLTVRAVHLPDFEFQDWIYKNPPKGTATFDTRRLNADSKVNTALLAAIREKIVAEGLLSQAKADFEAAKKAEAAKRRTEYADSVAWRMMTVLTALAEGGVEGTKDILFQLGGWSEDQLAAAGKIVFQEKPK